MLNGADIHDNFSDKAKGFTQIGEIDDPHACYSFDYFFVFKHDESGRIYYGIDSGCSCPTPFENDHWDGPDKTSFTEVTRTNVEDFVRELYAHYPGHDQDAKHDIERTVRAALK